MTFKLLFLLVIVNSEKRTNRSLNCRGNPHRGWSYPPTAIHWYRDKEVCSILTYDPKEKHTSNVNPGKRISKVLVHGEGILGQQFKLSVVSHRGKEVFQVAMMGFVNSLAYVQCQIDTILRDLATWCRAYVDDIFAASETLPEHCDLLTEVFGRLQRMNIKLQPKKSFVGFPSIETGVLKPSFVRFRTPVYGQSAQGPRETWW